MDYADFVGGKVFEVEECVWVGVVEDESVTVVDNGTCSSSDCPNSIVAVLGETV